MNQKRRKAIAKLTEEAKYFLSSLSGILSAEETAHENTPESKEDTQMYQESEEAIENMTDAVASIEEALVSLQSIAI